MENLNNNYNVRDYLKGKSIQEIKDILEPGRLNFSLLMENDIKDISRAGLVRTVNAFSGKRIITYGDKRRYDRRGCVGTYVYENFNYAKNIAELRPLLLPNSKLIAVEIIPNSIPVENFGFDYDAETIFMMGHEGSDGLSEELRNEADDFICIPQRGSIPSLNVIVAFGIVVYEYCRRCRNA